jgi:hypothetical protein
MTNSAIPLTIGINVSPSPCSADLYTYRKYNTQSMAAIIERYLKAIASTSCVCCGSPEMKSERIFFPNKNMAAEMISEVSRESSILPIAFKYLSIMAAMLWVLYFMYVYRSALQGLGDTLMPMVSGMAEFVMRISAALILPHFIGQDGIFFAEIAAWSGATVILCISYYARMHKYH